MSFAGLYAQYRKIPIPKGGDNPAFKCPLCDHMTRESDDFGTTIVTDTVRSTVVHMWDVHVIKEKCAKLVDKL